MVTRKIYVDVPFWAELVQYLQPQERFMSDDHGLVLFTYGGRLEFHRDRRQLRGVIVRPSEHCRRVGD
jgi:hypothetical protein